MKDREASVVAVTNGSLLTSGLVSVLQETKGVNVAVVEEHDADIYERIRDAHPAVVIVGADGAQDDGLNIRRLLEDNPSSTVFALSLGRPEIEVFHVQRINGPTVSDLLRLLEGARTKEEER